MRCWKYESAKGIVVETLVVGKFVYPVVTHQLRVHYTRVIAALSRSVPL